MAILTILEYPDQRLRTIAQPVTEFDDQLHAIIADMYDTMYAAKGLGLAATQVDIHYQIAVIDFSGNGTEKMCIINPEIIATHGQQYDTYGCLSVPNYPKITIRRAATVTIRALNQYAVPFELEARGDLAICIQHEMDHLVGKLYIDYLSPMQKTKLAKAFNYT